MSESENFPTTRLQVFTNPGEPQVRSNIHQVPQLSCVITQAYEKAQVIDVAYQQVANCTGRDFQHHMMMVVDLNDFHSFFQNIDFIEIEKSVDGLSLTFEVNFQFTTWQHSLSLLSYVEKLRERMYSDHAMSSTQENLYEEDLLHLRFSMDMGFEEAFSFVCQKFSESLELAHNYILSAHKLQKLVVNEIEISQNYTQAANLILNFLVTIMKRRMPNTDIRQTIVTGMNKSFLRISYPVAMARSVEAVLVDYADLIVGNMHSDCFFSSSSVMDAFFLRMEMARNEMSLLLNVGAKQASDEFLDNEMEAMKLHLSRAIHQLVNQAATNGGAVMTSGNESPPVLSA